MVQMQLMSSAKYAGRVGIAMAIVIALGGLPGCGGGEQGACTHGVHEQSRSPCQASTAQQDANAPSAPSTLAGSAASPSLINLTWNASTDNVAVAGYRIYRDGVLIATLGNVVDYQDAGLSAATTYSYTVQAFDDAGNASAQSPATIVTTPTVPDTVAPSTPDGLAAVAVSASRINLTWSASTDNVAVTAYRVFRDGALLVSVGNVTSYQDSSLTTGTTYVYTVRAVDAAGNMSGHSAQASATTSPAVDTIPPTTPTNLAANAVSPSRIDLSWSASTDNDAVVNYRLYRDGALVATVTSTNYQDTGLSAATTYSYRVEAVDATGNVSPLSSAVTAGTPSAPDTIAPSTPTGVIATAVSASRIDLNWTAATDNVAVTGYRIFRDGSLIDTVGNVTTYASTGLAPSTAYSYRIRAMDAAGNVSPQSTAASATTLTMPDTTAPTTPTGLAATVISSSRVSLTWSAATDNIAVTGYRIYRNGVFLATVGNVTTYESAGLSAATTYTYNVDAVDAAGNASGISGVASATTLAATTATLVWDAVAHPNLAGYRIYYGTAPGVYFQSAGQGVNVGNVTTHTLTGLNRGTRYYFVATAFDTSNNESPFSNEIFKDIP